MSKSSPNRVVVFESEERENFFPLSLTRPTFDFALGTCTLLQRIERQLGFEVTDLVVPKYLEDLTSENHQKAKINENIDEPCFIVNALVSNQVDLKREIANARSEGSNTISCDANGVPIVGFLTQCSPADLTNTALKSTKAKKSRLVTSQKSMVFKYLWDIVSANGEAIEQDVSDRDDAKKSEAASFFELVGNRAKIAETAEIQRFVTIDTRTGPVIVDDNAVVQSFTHIKGPAYIGKASTIKSALIEEGTTIGAHCKVSGEVEQSIISDYSNKNHAGFCGHSYVGSWANIGAMTTNSDLKNTYGEIKANVCGRQVNTKSNKVGVFIGDMAKTAIGTMIFSGRSIGVSTHLYGIVTEDVPSFTIFAKSLGTEKTELLIASAIDTQRRMMKRRGIELSKNYLNMMKTVFDMTSTDRLKGKVRKGKFQI